MSRSSRGDCWRCTRRYLSPSIPRWPYHVLTHLRFQAGGYDAIWLLVFDPPTKHDTIHTPVACVEILWGRRKKQDVTPLRAEESVTKKGIQAEQLHEVPGLLKAISHVQN